MSDLIFRPAEHGDLDRTVELMGLGFPAAHKFSRTFLEWQYYENPAGEPLGCNIDDGERLIGHLMGIPLNVRLRGRSVVVTLIMNVATHPDYRGRGLFLDLVRRVAAMSAARGHEGVVGIANQQTIRAYETKLGFQNVAGLDAHVELLPQKIDMGRALADAEFAHRWEDATFAWRLRNPSNPLRVAGGTAETLIVEGASTMPLVRARGSIPREGLSIQGAGLPLGAAVVLGLTPKGAARRRLAVTVPAALRPSPLRMIWFSHKTPGDRLDPKRILFSFLDFDAF
jgi:GNAT superfamily N-acetyltransferase